MRKILDAWIVFSSPLETLYISLGSNVTENKNENEMNEKQQSKLNNSANKKNRFVMRRCHVVNSPSNYIQFHLFSAWINFPFLSLLFQRFWSASSNNKHRSSIHSLDFSCHYYSIRTIFFVSVRSILVVVEVDVSKMDSQLIKQTNSVQINGYTT